MGRNLRLRRNRQHSAGWSPLIVLAAIVLLSRGCEAHAQTDRGPAAPVDAISGVNAELQGEVSDDGEAVRDTAPLEPVAVPEHSVVSADKPVEPGIVMPDRVDVGKFIRGHYDGPEIPGTTARYEWLPGAGLDFHVLPDGRSYLATAPPSKAGERYPLDLKVFLKFGEQELPPYKYSDSVFVGEPPPDPPLSTLVSKQQASLLSGWYTAMAAVVKEDPRKIDTAAAFWSVHGAKLASLDLDGSPFDVAVKSRFAPAFDGEKVDGVKLVAALEGVVKELNATPVPPPPPPPGPSPIPAPGLHVLIVEETDDRNKLPAGQLGALQSTLIRGEVQSSGGQFRQYDDDPPIAEPLWSAARSRPRTALPWIIVSNSTGGFEGPLPASVDETLALIRRFK